jgi:predicted Zn-dependent protease
MVAQTTLQAAGTALGASGATPLLSQAAMAALGAGTQVGVLLPFSRAHESEADYIGILLAAEAGFDPREAIRLWERMEQASRGQSPPQFLSTHPSHGTRIKQLEKWMEEALPIYQAKQPALNNLKGARNPRRISDFMKKQCVAGLAQLQNRYLLAPHPVHLPVAGPHLALASWIPSPNVCDSQGGSLRKTPDDIVCKEVWTPRPLTRRVIASTPI